jgi:hypothetical protein
MAVSRKRASRCGAGHVCLQVLNGPITTGDDVLRQRIACRELAKASPGPTGDFRFPTAHMACHRE